MSFTLPPVFFLFVLPAFMSGQPHEKSFSLNDSVSQYKVKYLKKNNFNIDGHITEKDWESCGIIESFISPWKPDTPEKTVFRAAYDNRFFYFSFFTEDSNIVISPDKDELAVTEGDRIEMFFSGSRSLATYYCFEISPTGLVFDYQAAYHRKFNNQWDYREILVKTEKRQNEYSVEGRIPLTFFSNFLHAGEPIKGKSVYTGVFRADKDDTETAYDRFTWLSWIDPKSETPDFHVPSAMGIFQFE